MADANRLDAAIIDTADYIAIYIATFTATFEFNFSSNARWATCASNQRLGNLLPMESITCTVWWLDLKVLKCANYWIPIVLHLQLPTITTRQTSHHKTNRMPPAFNLSVSSFILPRASETGMPYSINTRWLRYKERTTTYKGRTPERTTFFSPWTIPGDNIQPLRLNSVLQSSPLSWEDTYGISGGPQHGPQHGRENGGGDLQTDLQAPNLGLRILNYDGVIETPASTTWEKQFRLSSTLLNRVGSRPGNLAGAGIIWWPIWGG